MRSRDRSELGTFAPTCGNRPVRVGDWMPTGERYAGGPDASTRRVTSVRSESHNGRAACATATTAGSGRRTVAANPPPGPSRALRAWPGATLPTCIVRREDGASAPPERADPGRLEGVPLPFGQGARAGGARAPQRHEIRGGREPRRGRGVRRLGESGLRAAFLAGGPVVRGRDAIAPRHAFDASRHGLASGRPELGPASRELGPDSPGARSGAREMVRPNPCTCAPIGEARLP